MRKLFNQFAFFEFSILYSVPERTSRRLLTSWQKSKQDTELWLFKNNEKKTPLDGDLPADVLQIRRFLFFSTGVCDGGALKISPSVPLMCFVSQGRALAGPMDSPQYSVECGPTAERGGLDGKTPSTPVGSL